MPFYPCLRAEPITLFCSNFYYVVLRCIFRSKVPEYSGPVVGNFLNQSAVEMSTSSPAPRDLYLQHQHQPNRIEQQFLGRNIITGDSCEVTRVQCSIIGIQLGIVTSSFNITFSKKECVFVNSVIKYFLQFYHLKYNVTQLVKPLSPGLQHDEDNNDGCLVRIDVL